MDARREFEAFIANKEEYGDPIINNGRELRAHLKNTDLSNPEQVKSFIAHYLNYTAYSHDDSPYENANTAFMALRIMDLPQPSADEIAKITMLSELAQAYGFSQEVQDALKTHANTQLTIKGSPTSLMEALAKHYGISLQKIDDEIRAQRQILATLHVEKVKNDSQSYHNELIQKIENDFKGLMISQIEVELRADIGSTFNKEYPELANKLYKQMMTTMPESALKQFAETTSYIDRQAALMDYLRNNFWKSTEVQAIVNDYHQAGKVIEDIHAFKNNLNERNPKQTGLKNAKQEMLTQLENNLMNQDKPIAERLREFKEAFNNNKAVLSTKLESSPKRFYTNIKQAFNKKKFSISFWKNPDKDAVKKISIDAGILPPQKGQRR